MHHLCRASGAGAHALRHSQKHCSASSVGRVGHAIGVARGRLGSVLPRQAAMSTESSTSQKGGSLLGRFAAWYNKCMEAKPLITTSLTTGIISSVGDAGSQLLIEKEGWDVGRTSRFGLIGIVFTGPVLFKWYGFLYQRLGGIAPMRVLQRVAADQAFFAPLFTATILSVLFTVENRGSDAFIAHMHNNFAESIAVNWMMWIPAQIVNFRFVPPMYNVLFANFVAVFWNSYLSWNAHRDAVGENIPE